MCFPHCNWPLERQVPRDDPPVGIACQKSTISRCEMDRMKLSGVASEDEGRLSRRVDCPATAHYACRRPKTRNRFPFEGAIS